MSAAEWYLLKSDIFNTASESVTLLGIIFFFLNFSFFQMKNKFDTFIFFQTIHQ